MLTIGRRITKLQIYFQLVDTVSNLLDDDVIVHVDLPEWRKSTIWFRDQLNRRSLIDIGSVVVQASSGLIFVSPAWKSSSFPLNPPMSHDPCMKINWLSQSSLLLDIRFSSMKIIIIIIIGIHTLFSHKHFHSHLPHDLLTQWFSIAFHCHFVADFGDSL